MEKNEKLTIERGISFDEVVERIESGARVIETEHPNPGKYPDQRLLIVEINCYAYLIPFVRDGEEYFLKTIIPSRKATKKYFGGKMTNKDKAAALNEYEKEILDAYEKGELQAVDSGTDYQKIAKNTMKKNRKINIRISENDLSALRRRAAREGIPYQTLIGSVLHKYASGYLKEIAFPD